MRAAPARLLIWVSIAIVASVFYYYFCRTTVGVKSKGIQVEANYYTAEELLRQKELVKEGNTDAAMDLYRYYSKIEKDPVAAQYYLELGQKGGRDSDGRHPPSGR